VIERSGSGLEVDDVMSGRARRVTIAMRSLLHATLLLSSLGAAGCGWLGPAAVRSGRYAYNQAIIATDSEQLLGTIVRIRYGEPTGLLAVTSITSNLQVRADAGANFGIGPRSNYAGNLVPLAAGLGYEENPTISYTPVQGAKYLRTMLSPLPIDLTVLLLGAMAKSPQVMTLLVEGVNGIRNPDFLADATDTADPRFGRIVELFAALDRDGHVAWTPGSGDPATVALHFAGEGAGYAQRVRELYALLGLAAPRMRDGAVTLPVVPGFERRDGAVLRLDTRSLWDILTIAAAAVEVPAEDVESGLAERLPPPGAAGRSIRISRSEHCPDRAMIAVEERGYWYSIDATDQASKLTFRILETLVSVQMAETVESRKSAPVLTVPVSR